MIQIQATFAGYGDKACSLFSAYDADARVLVVGAEADYRTERRDNCIVLTNIPDLPRDSLFIEADLSVAISAFYALKAGIAADGKSSRLAFAQRASRANPEHAIEQDGIDASGPRYRISPTITCSQVAALATCQYALRSDTVERVVELADYFRSLSAGGIVTI